MRVKETNLGRGLSRLEVEPMCSSEMNLPTEVVDEIMRDIISRKGRNGTREENVYVPKFSRPMSTMDFHCGCENRECMCGRRPEMNREPDGIDVHVDRPLRENFADIVDWINAMDKYRTLEDAAKECDWECREPMKGTCECERKPRYNENWFEEEFVDELEDDDFDEFEDEDDAQLEMRIYLM